MWRDNALGYPYFSSSESSLLAHIERVDLRLQHYYHQRSENAWYEEVLLPSSELKERMRRGKGVPYWLEKERSYENNGLESLIMLHDEPLMQVMNRFELTEFEVQVLILSTLPHVTGRYCDLFASIQGKGRNVPTVELALDLFCPSLAEKFRMQNVFLPQSPLFANMLLQSDKETFLAKSGWGKTPLVASPEVWHFLLGEHFQTPEMGKCSRWISVINESDLTPGEQRLGLAADSAFFGPVTTIVLLRGATEHQVARMMETRGYSLLRLDVECLPVNDAAAWQVFRQILCQVRLHQAALLIRSLNKIKEKRYLIFNYITQDLACSSVPTFCLMDKNDSPPHFPGCAKVIFDMPKLTMVEQEVMLTPWIDDSAKMKIRTLSQRFTFNNEELPAIQQEASFYGELHNEKDAAINWHRALDYRTRQNFGHLAQRVKPKRKLDDLIIPTDLYQQLQEISAAVQYRNELLEGGFDKKINYGTGISAMFYGPSGTGKTMAAEVLAHAMQTDLIKIDLSSVVNKYIGETEKNLSRIFDLAEADAGVLFFDEADALFGKRSQVKDAQDRHANIEVSYLLQRLENFPGLVILATNHRNHVDEAFSRRFTFITRFSFPDAELREKMWRSIWPSGIQVDEQIDFCELAKRIEVTGANIRNIALLSCWLGQAEGCKKVMATHIERAIQRELAKVGRIKF